MAWAAVGVGGFQVISGMQQAETIRNNAKITQEVANLNAGYAELDAYNATQAGISKAARYQEVINKTVGAQKVAMAAQGQDVNFGTAAQITAETKLKGILNQADITQEANMRAMGYKTEAMNRRLAGAHAASEATLAAATAQTTGILQGATTIVSKFGKTNPNPSGDELAAGGSSGYHLDNYSFGDE